MNNLFLKVSILSASILLIIALITYFKIDEVSKKNDLKFDTPFNSRHIKVKKFLKRYFLPGQLLYFLVLLIVPRFAQQPCMKFLLGLMK